MKAFIKKLSLLLAVGAMAFGSNLSHDETKANAAALGDGYTKVKNISTLINDDQVVIWCDANSYGLSGWNGSKDGKTTKSEAELIKYVVEVGTNGVYLRDTVANNYISSPGSSNQFKYGTKAICTVDSNGVLKCNDRYLAANGTYIRMYESVGSHKPFYVYKVESSGEQPEEPETPTEGGYTLVEKVSDLAVGKKVIIAAKDSEFAMSTTQNDNNRGQASITKKGNIATLGDNVQEFTLESGNESGAFAFNTGKGYIYAASSSKNYLRTETTLSKNSSWKITIESGTTTIVAQGSNTRNTLQYNPSSSIFACYGSASQKAVCLYVLNEGNSGDSGETTPVYPTDFTLSDESISLFVKQTKTLSVSSYTPSNTTVKNVSYTSNNTSVATVDAKSGLITAVAVGSATITVTVEGESGSIAKTCAITVEEATLSSISWKARKLSFNENEKFNLGSAVITAIYSDESEVVIEHTDENLSFTLGEETIDFNRVLTVDDDGKMLSISYMGKESQRAAITIISSSFDTITEGKYIITATNEEIYYLPTAATESAPAATLYNENVVDAWTFTEVEGVNGQFTIKNNNGDGLYSIDENKGIRIAANKTDAWEVILNSDGETYTIKHVELSRTLSLYNKQDWRGYKGASGIQKLVLIPLVEKEITSLSYEGKPTKTTYIEGQSFDPTGLTINATYSDGSTGTMSPNLLSWSPEVLTSSTTSVTGTYGEFSVTIDKIVVNPLTTFGFPTISNTDATALMPSTNGESTEDSYFLAGIVTNIKNTEYGNIYFKDADGTEFYIYGTYLLDGTKYDGMSTKPGVGDEIVVYGSINNYKNTAQLKNAILVSINETILEETFVLINDVINANTCTTEIDKINEFKTRYNDLGTENQAIFNSIVIDSQSKYEQDANAPTVTLIKKLEYMESYAIWKDSHPSSGNLGSNLLSNITSSNNILIILVVGLLGLTSILGYYFLNKKKYAR